MQTTKINTDKPYIPDYSRGNVTYGYVGGKVNLSCDAVAEPPANFTWSSNNKKFSHKNHTIYGGQHVSLLQVSHLSLPFPHY